MRFWRGRSEDAGDTKGLHLVVGLGNPGREYEATRHNVGFMVVDELAGRAGGRFTSSRQRADVARVQLASVPVLLAKPVTFMNESGFAVSHLVRYYHLPLERLLVISDDIDLPFGTVRLRTGGSAGGQRGLQSIITELGTNEFARLRLGVSRPRGSAVSHVLHPFAPAEREQLPRLLSVAADAVLAALTRGVQPAANEFNRNWLDSPA